MYGQALTKFRRMNIKPAKPDSDQSNTVVSAAAPDNTVIKLNDFDTTMSAANKQKKAKKRQSSVPYTPALRSTRSYKRKAMKVSGMDFVEI